MLIHVHYCTHECMCEHTKFLLQVMYKVQITTFHTELFHSPADMPSLTYCVNTVRLEVSSVD